MPVSTEKQLQLRICEELVLLSEYKWTPPTDLEGAREAAGTLPPTDANAWDREQGFYPPDIFDYLRTTQGDAYDKVWPTHQSPEQRAAIEKTFLAQLAKSMDRPFMQGGGLLNLLRAGFTFTIGSVTQFFRLGQLSPDSASSAKLMGDYEANILRVIHEVKYSATKQDRIDLVGTLNGLPVWDLELKNGTSQLHTAAEEQYRQDRAPWIVDVNGKRQGKKVEPLLAGKRSLVHFAVDPWNVSMTSELAGKDTVFLPFNADYTEEDQARDLNRMVSEALWQDVLAKDSLLGILKYFAMQQTLEDKSSGKAREVTTFPRYHQWFGDMLALALTQQEGPGHSNLMMWSAGSGKSYGISWLAHALNSLHWDTPTFALERLSPRLKAEVEKVAGDLGGKPLRIGRIFTGGGLVITDRTVLDRQLSETLVAKQEVAGIVQAIKAAGGKQGYTSKKQHLVKSLQETVGGIRVLTLQTFIYALDAIDEIAKANRSAEPLAYFVIQDEVHSSEGGSSSEALRELLNSASRTDGLSQSERVRLRKVLERGDDVADELNELVEKQLRAKQQAKADGSNITYFGFTATPKERTLEHFGRRREGSKELQPLHTYSMGQAIAEGFILDTLQNYTTYEVATHLDITTEAGQQLVDSREGKRALAAWIQVHPKTLTEKAGVIIEHFQSVVRPSLAKDMAQGMVFTSSREESLAMHRELVRQAKAQRVDLGVLVAFSGELTDEQSGEVLNEAQASEVTGRDIARVFEKGSGGKRYHLLVVADKYSTGYDNPRLCGAYVDKKLAGTLAVQTLARLNRSAQALGKQQVYVLDFANKAEDIYDAHQHFYKSLSLAERSDPNLLHRLQQEIEGYHLYNEDDLETWHQARLTSSVVIQSNTTVRVRNAYNWQREQAIEQENDLLQQYYGHFRGLVQKYVEVYQFQSTMIDYGDSRFEKLAHFYSALLTALRSESNEPVQKPSLDGVDLASVQLRQLEATKQTQKPVDPLGPAMAEPGEGSGASREQVYLKVLVEYLNQALEGVGVSTQDVNALTEHLLRLLGDNATVRRKARSNELERFVESDAARQEFTKALFGAYEAYGSAIGTLMSDPGLADLAAKHTLRAIWQQQHG